MFTSLPSRFARFYRSRPLIGGSLIGPRRHRRLPLDPARPREDPRPGRHRGLPGPVIPIVLVVLGVLIVVDPGHRIFYGVIALAVAIYAIDRGEPRRLPRRHDPGHRGRRRGALWMPPASRGSSDSPSRPRRTRWMPIPSPRRPPRARRNPRGAALADGSPAAEPRPFVRRPADTGRRTAPGSAPSHSRVSSPSAASRSPPACPHRRRTPRLRCAADCSASCVRPRPRRRPPPPRRAPRRPPPFPFPCPRSALRAIRSPASRGGPAPRRAPPRRSRPACRRRPRP